MRSAVMRSAVMRSAELRTVSLDQRRRSECRISVSGSACRGLASLTTPQLVTQGHLTRHVLAGEFT